MQLPEFEYFAPETLEEAYSLLARYNGEARVLAGGTDLIVKMKHRQLIPRYLINIKKIPGLDDIEFNAGEGLRIGALTTIQAIKNSLPTRQRFNALYQAASVLSTPQVRNIATIGGNLANASPAAETAPPLIAFDAMLKIAGANGERTIAVEDFFVGPGETVLKPGEIIVEVQVPALPPGSDGVYLKHGERLADIAIVGVAVVANLDGKRCNEIKIALASVAPTPIRAKNAEELLKGQELNEELLEKAGQVASEESSPIDDLRAYGDYRRQMVAVLVKQAIEQAMERIRLGGC